MKTIQLQGVMLFSLLLWKHFCVFQTTDLHHWYNDVFKIQLLCFTWWPPGCCVHPKHPSDKRQRSGAGEERERTSSAPASGHERISSESWAQGIHHRHRTINLCSSLVFGLWATRAVRLYHPYNALLEQVLPHLTCLHMSCFLFFVLGCFFLIVVCSVFTGRRTGSAQYHSRNGN